ncbi:MAG TPA: tetratricopeptide repeat protein [Terriglobales bacterium]|nr:tetratricopeptide repeat protein [Terriglobales bacterium]
MKPRRRITVIFGTMLLLCISGAAFLLAPLDRVRARTTEEEALYIPSAAVLKKASLGYTGLMADIYWTRAVQYYGRRHVDGMATYPLLYQLLDISTTLDPQLLVAYQFGSIFLSQKSPSGAGQPDKAAQLVERGIAANPSDWTLYYNLGFIYYDMGAYREASEVFLRGSQVPNANPALHVLAATTAEKGGNPETARLLWTKIYETSSAESVRKNALQHLIALKIDEEVPTLERLVRKFRESTGRTPSNFEEMVAAGWLTDVPVDPTGQIYRLLPDGRVELQSPEKKPYVHFGLPGGPSEPQTDTAP